MNILVLNNTSDLYGGSRILSIVAAILKQGGHTPIVILSEDGPLTAELDRLGVEWKIIRLGILRRKYLSVAGILNRVRVTSQAWKALSEVVKERNIQMVYSNTTGVFIGAFLAKRRKLKHIWHVHEIITKPKAFTTVLSYLLEKYADLVIVVSEAVKAHWTKHIRSTPVVRIYNGIDTKPFENAQVSLRRELGIANDRLIMMMIGRVNHWKGHQYFLDIATHIEAARKDISFVLAGDAYPGNEHLVAQLRERISKLTFKDHVHYIGYREDIPGLLNSADLFILPSTLPDPFPTVILESMASGTPVAATAHGGALEMIDSGKTGIHIPFDDAAAAAAKILEISASPDELIQMGERGRAKINAQYSLEAFKENILRAVGEV